MGSGLLDEARWYVRASGRAERVGGGRPGVLQTANCPAVECGHAFAASVPAYRENASRARRPRPTSAAARRLYSAVNYSCPGATASGGDDFGSRVTLAPTQEHRGCGCEHE